MDDTIDQTRVGAETRSQIEDLLLLQRVAQRISAIRDLNELLEQIVDDVKTTFGYSRTGVLFLDEVRQELEIVAVRGWTVNFHVKGDRFKVGWGMIGHAAATGRTHYAPDVEKDPHYMVSEDTTRSEVDIPIKMRGKLIGVFNAQHSEVDAFPPHRIQLLEALAGHLGVAIENARAFERERLERERMEEELAEARAIQTRLFPEQSPEVPGYRLSGLSRPCLSVGGDWYDYIPLKDGRVAFVLGDVSGKGPGAALVMTSTRSIVRMHAERDPEPGKLMDRVNRILKADLPAGKFVTMICALLDPDRRTLTFVNAGHPPPVRARDNDARLLRTTPQLPLAVAIDPYQEHVIELAPGDRIVLYSDGLIEARNHDREEYGIDRLLQCFLRPALAPVDLLRDVEAYGGGVPVGDDVTIVMLEADPLA